MVQGLGLDRQSGRIEAPVAATYSAQNSKHLRSSELCDWSWHASQTGLVSLIVGLKDSRFEFEIPLGPPGDRPSISYCEGARGNLSINRLRLQEFICESLCSQLGADTASNETWGT